MAKAIIKTIVPSTAKSVTTTTTVVYDAVNVSRDTVYDASTPVGQTMVGTLEDSSNPPVTYDFEQPFGTELGLVVGSKVNFSFVVIAGKSIANAVKLIEKGVIETINATNDGGTLLDKSTKQSIPYSHMYCKESLLVAPSQGVKGSTVSFERVVDPKTAAITATALEFIK